MGHFWSCGKNSQEWTRNKFVCSQDIKSIIMNFDRYPWLADLSSVEGQAQIATARLKYKQNGAGKCRLHDSNFYFASSFTL